CDNVTRTCLSIVHSYVLLTHMLPEVKVIKMLPTAIHIIDIVLSLLTSEMVARDVSTS
ncbi:hypothetical protein NDU88_002232, partial [Pleurodeles waltl]